MSISRRALYEAGLPFGDSATYRKATGGRVYGDGGGSSAPTTQTTVTDIPDWAKPYGKEILGKAQALTDQPYQPYTGGERIAGFTPLQQRAQAATGTMTTAPQLQAATGLAGLGALQSLGAGAQYGMAAQPYLQALGGAGARYGYGAAPDIAAARGTGAALQQQLAPGVAASMGAGAQYGMAAQPYLQALGGAGAQYGQAAAGDISAIRGTGADIQQRIDPALAASMGAGAQYGQMATDPGSTQAYMSPYMQNVVDVQQREAMRQADIARTGRGSQAVRAGAFGGSRQAIMEAEAERNLQQQLGDIQARGSQQAFEQARQAQQFGSELGLRGLGQGLQAQQAASQLGLSGLERALAGTQFGSQLGMQGMQAALAGTQAGAELGLRGMGQGMQAQQAAAQLGLSGLERAMQGTQFGADLGMRGTQAALAGVGTGAELGLRGAGQAGQIAQTLGGLGATEFGQQKDIIGLQSAAGKEQQALEQQRLDQRYQDFIRQQQYPYQQLGFMSDMLRGVPVGQTSQTIFQQPPASTLGQLAGLGTGLYGLSQMGFRPFAEGGPVAKYADQGSVTSATNIADIVDGLSDEQLQAAYQSAVARQDVKTVQIIQEEMADRALTREGRGLAAAADIPEDMFSAGAAKGGIMKFAEGTNPYGFDPDLSRRAAEAAEQQAAAINAPQGGTATATGVPPVAPGLTRASLVQQGMDLRKQPLPGPSAEDPYLAAAQAAQAREIEAAAASRKAQEEGFAIDRQESAERIRELKESGLGAAIAALGFSAARAASKPGATLLGSFSEGTKDMEAAMSENRKSLKEARDADKALAREERKLRIAMDEGDAKRAADHQREIARIRAEKAKLDDSVRRTNAIIRGNEVSGLAALAGALPQEPVPGELLQVADRLKKADPSLSDTAAMEKAAQIIQTKSPSYLTPGQLKPADLIKLANAYETQKRELIRLHPLARLPNPTTPAAIKERKDFERRLRELQKSFRIKGLPDIEMGITDEESSGGVPSPRVVGVRPSAG